MTRVVNLFGGPSAGKSTLAAQLFGYMKSKRLNCEYVSEYAKDLTWKKSSSLDDQIHILGEQHHRLYVLLNQVDWIITDSPLLLGIYYVNLGQSKFQDNPEYVIWREAFNTFVLATYFQYNNYNFEVIRGDRKFVQAGRNQTEEEAVGIDVVLRDLLASYQIPHTPVASLDDLILTLGFDS